MCVCVGGGPSKLCCFIKHCGGMGLGKWVHSHELQLGRDDRAREEGYPAVVEKERC